MPGNSGLRATVRSQRVRTTMELLNKRCRRRRRRFVRVGVAVRVLAVAVVVVVIIIIVGVAVVVVVVVVGVVVASLIQYDVTSLVIAGHRISSDSASPRPAMRRIPIIRKKYRNILTLL